MALEKDRFWGIWEKGQEIKKAFHYLKTNSYFEDLDEYDLQKLALVMSKKAFEKGEVIAKEGEHSGNIIYVIYGQIEVIKLLQFREK